MTNCAVEQAESDKKAQRLEFTAVKGVLEMDTQRFREAQAAAEERLSSLSVQFNELKAKYEAQNEEQAVVPELKKQLTEYQQSFEALKKQAG